MSPRERAEPGPAREWSLWIAVLLVVLALGAGALWWRWQQRQSAPAVPTATAPGVPQPDIAPPAPCRRPWPRGRSIRSMLRPMPRCRR
ncbi:MAG: hypothetical protein WKG52_07230 [Variovorax sp.]